VKGFAMADHIMMGGRLHVYKRENSRYWQCSTFIGGKNRRTSTKEESIDRAKDIAEDWYLGLKGKHKAGILRDEKTFQQAADQFQREFEIITEGQRSKVYVEGHWRRLKLHLLPFFGDMGLSEITSGQLQEYRIKRRQDSELARGKPPARNTMHQEIVCLRQVLKTAVRHGWMSYLPDMSEPYKTSGKISHRAWFSLAEYRQLYEATARRIKNPPKPKWKWACEQLHDFVLFMGNTGLRPDEALRLEFRDVTIVEDRATRETILEIEVRGKRGVGYCKSTKGAVYPFKRLLERLRPEGNVSESDDRFVRADTPRVKPKPTDRIFPKSHHELLGNILGEEGLKFDREGQRRTAYSLRHTYICLRLMEGADIYQIAKNCRTSVEMIEKYYASHIKNRLDAKAINVRKRKLPKKRVKDAPSKELAV
jgi:integrase